MAEPKRTNLSVRRKRAVLVAVVLPPGDRIGNRAQLAAGAGANGSDGALPRGGGMDPLDELAGLAKTAGVRVVGRLVQHRQFPDAATCLGKGKVEELKRLVAAEQADTVIFDSNLSPSQSRNLEKQLGVAVVDRSELILSIFAEHARSHESQLQVELAQLLYMRTRLKRLWTHLERIEGGTGTRGGPGEQQIELDRRMIDNRVVELRQRLKQVEQRRERQVAQRRQQVTVSLVGYTNAGKSTLMNALTGAGVYVADQLFATLDTRTRAWNIPHFGRVLLSDTVGFIRDLPHNLVASFRSTLEEARHADLLLHVVDASSPAAEQQIQTVNEVLQEIGIEASQSILVLNKIDAVADRSLLDVLLARHPRAVAVSAARQIGLKALAAMAAERLSGGYVEALVETAVDNGRLFSFLQAHAEVTERHYTDANVTLRCRVPRRFLAEVGQENATVRILEALPANGAAPGAR